MQKVTWVSALFLAVFNLQAAAQEKAAKSDAATGQPTVVALWPGKPPGEKGDFGEEKITRNDKTYIVTDVSKPTLTIYRPDRDKNTGTALIIAPGGAYKFLAMGHEGENIVKWCSSIGVTGIILKYRVPRRSDNPVAAFQDGQRAVSLVRSQASDWGIDPNRIGMIGFSAGGGVTNHVIVNAAKRSYEPIDDVDNASPRLDYAVLIYAAGSLAKAGKEDVKPPTLAKDSTPPTFICCAYNDMFAEGSVQSFLALKKAGVPAELHIYAAGGHGFGIRPQNDPLIADWPNRLEGWLRHQKLLEHKK